MFAFRGRLAALLLLALGVAGSAIADDPLRDGLYIPNIAGFSPRGQATLNASAVSSAIALPSVSSTAVITNTGATIGYVQFGAAGVTASAATSYPIYPGQTWTYDVAGFGYVAAVTGSGSAALSITTGYGLPVLANPAGSGSGGGGGGGAYPFSNAAAMTVGSTYSPGQGVLANLTAAGNVTLTLSGGGSLTEALNAGVSVLPYSVTAVASSTATGTYYTLTASSSATPAAFTSATAMTVGTTYSAGKALVINDSAAGNVSLAMAGGGTLVMAINAGISELPFSVTAINSAGTTATATYSNLN